MSRELTVALVGATGVVGLEFLRQMEARAFPVGELRLLATSRSAGKTLSFRGEALTVRETTPEAFAGADVAFISATTAASRELCPLARDRGAIVFDDSSAFRQEPSVPLVVPEINAEELRRHEGIIATPNCTTVPLVLTLAPLLGARRIRRVIADTYQAVSGAGAAAMEELRRQTAAALGEGAERLNRFPQQIAFNAVPCIDSFHADGYTNEERKMMLESRKILHLPDLALSATCVRIPTLISHALAVHVDLDAPLEREEARALWRAQPGLVVQDDPLNNRYPTPLDCTAQDAVFVGRARQDVSNPNGLAYWCVTDNLRKGAALNILQMVEWMQAHDCL